MRRFWHLLLPPLALLTQALPPFAILAIAERAYGTPSTMSEPVEIVLSRVVLAVAAIIGFAGGSAGIYLALARSRLWLALAMIVVFCLPALAGASIYLYALAWFVGLA